MGGVHFQGFLTFVVPQPVVVGHHLAGLVIVENAVDGARGLRDGGEDGRDAEQHDKEGGGGFGHDGGFCLHGCNAG